MITTLRLRNIKTHADTVLQFGPGVTAITGDSGSGKSGILEALAPLLYGQAFPPHLVRQNGPKPEKQAEVELELASGDYLRIVRKSSGISGSYRMDGQEQQFRSVSGMEEEIARWIGIRSRVIDPFNIKLTPHYMALREGPFPLIGESPATIQRIVSDLSDAALYEQASKGADGERQRLAVHVQHTQRALEESEAAFEKLMQDREQLPIIDKQLEAIIQASEALDMRSRQLEAAARRLPLLRSRLAKLRRIQQTGAAEITVPAFSGRSAEQTLKALRLVAELRRKIDRLGLAQDAETPDLPRLLTAARILRERDQGFQAHDTALQRVHACIDKRAQMEKNNALAEREHAAAHEQLQAEGVCPLCGSSF